MSSHTPTFLGLPAELRNTIYKYAFTSRRKSRLAPHALTRVNQQIRRESLAMYYSCVKRLSIPLRNLNEISRARKWLDEEDTGLYPVLPDLRISPPSHFKPIRRIRCTRKEVDVGKKLSSYLEKANRGGVERSVYEGMRVVYRRYIGVSQTRKARLGEPSHRFRKAALKGEKWIMHDIAYEDRFSLQAECRSPEEQERLFGMFFRLVVEVDGREWNKGNLEGIIDFFEESILRHEPRTHGDGVA